MRKILLHSIFSSQKFGPRISQTHSQRIRWNSRQHRRSFCLERKWKDILFQGEFMSYKSNSVLKGIPTFQGDKYYRFDPEERPPVKRSYPKPVENWEGIPGHIDDALQYKNGYTYFFKQGRYWRFDDKNFGVSTLARRGLAKDDFVSKVDFYRSTEPTRHFRGQLPIGGSDARKTTVE